MPVLNYLRQRLRLPRRVALIFGIGAISRSRPLPMAGARYQHANPDTAAERKGIW
jgi:hypothetical protein